jgi:hypothetical protein
MTPAITACLGEQWRTVPGFPGYEVSDHGRVRSWKTNSKRGRLRDDAQLRTLRSNRKRYRTINLQRDGETYSRLVHRLVLEAFVGACPEGMECRHLDGTRTNNVLSNLEWATHQTNIDDTERHQTRSRGDRGNTCSKLTVAQVMEIRSAPEGYRLLAKRYGVSRGTIQHICQGRRWKCCLPQRESA